MDSPIYAASSSPPPKTSLLCLSSTSTATATATATITSTASKSILLLLYSLLIFLSSSFIVLYSSSPPSSPEYPSRSLARALSSLSHHPTVILISADAFRFGYEHKTHLPSISRLISNGTSADLGLIPVFPTLTFPNHYSIATGLYPPHHGIISNSFLDPVSGRLFSPDSLDPLFWLGQPIWSLVLSNNLSAATVFWPGSQVLKPPWSCPPLSCHPYNKSTPFTARVDAVLSYFDLPSDRVPSLITLYFEEPDLHGHEFGPDDPHTTSAVAQIDRMIGRLIAGLEKRRIFEDVTVILLGDHGMVGICESKYIYLEDLSPWVQIPASWVQSFSPLFALQPPPGVPPADDFVERMNEGLSSGKVRNGENLRMYLKEELPERLHYSGSDRIPPIIGMLDEGYKVVMSRSSGAQECGGDHGYDNAFFSMRTIFVAHGPQFGRGRTVPSFENVEIYNLIAKILKLKGVPPNNGSDSFAESILLPST